MQQTTNYNLLIPEGTDVVNPLTQVNPNFQTIDGAMFANKQASIGTASEVVTGTVHAINRNNPDSDVFRFTATGAWTSGDTMTLDGLAVTVHLSDGTTPATNSYIIGAEVLAMVNGTLVTLAISTTPPAQGVTSFNSRTGAVVPAASDYDSSMIDYDNTASGLNATDVQSAIDEVVDIVGSNVHTTTTYDTLAENVPYSVPADGFLRLYIVGGTITISIDNAFSVSLANAQTFPLYVRKGQTIEITSMTAGNTVRFHPLSAY